MTLDVFFTLQNLQNGQKQNPLTTLQTQGDADLQALNFIDMMLARLTESAETTGQDNEEENGLLDSENPALDKLPKLDIARLLAENPEIEEQVKQSAEILDSDLLAKINEVLTLNQLAFQKVLTTDQDELLAIDFSELNQDQLNEISDSLLLKLKEEDNAGQPFLVKLLKTISELGEEGSPVLTTTNLTPEQITQIQDQVEAILAQQNEDLDNITEDDAVLGYVIGLVQILPPQARPDVVVVQRGVIFADRPLNIKQMPGNTATPANDLGGTLNQLTSPSSGTPLADIGSDADYDASDFGSSKDFKALIKEMGSPSQADAAQIANGVSTTSGNPAPQVQNTTSYLQNWAQAPLSGIFSSFEWASNLLNQTIASITGPAALTSHITQAQAATQAHPATQMIAVALQQQANNPQNKTLTLRLDPPDLGRVEVQMNFAKTKSMQAHMVIEKPETFLMLQRDAQLLERTIQEIGLDSDSGVSFELAEGGYDFDHNGGHDGQGQHAQSGAENDEDIEIIESTMTWFVDPVTGHTSYNIIA